MGELFDTGRIYFTCGVNDHVASNTQFAMFISDSLNRHIKGDWGDMCEEDREENQFALDRHLRLFSSYERAGQPKIWIITEADRLTTTILFPDEY